MLFFAFTVVCSVISVFYFSFTLFLIVVLLACVVLVFAIMAFASTCLKLHNFTVRDWLYLLAILPCLWWYDLCLCLGCFAMAVMILALICEYIFGLFRRRDTYLEVKMHGPLTTTSASSMFNNRARYSVFHLFYGPMSLRSNSNNSSWKRTNTGSTDSFSLGLEPSSFTTSLSSSTETSVFRPDCRVSTHFPVPNQKVNSFSTMDALSVAMESLNLVDLSNVLAPSSITDRNDTSLLGHGADAYSFSACRCSGSGRTVNGDCSCLGHTCSGVMCACSRGGGARDLRRFNTGGIVTGLTSLFGSSWDGGLICPWLWYKLADVRYRLSSLSIGNSVDAVIPGAPLGHLFKKKSSGYKTDECNTRAGVDGANDLRL